MPSDKEYKITKKIMIGKASMNPDFIPLANFIDKTFQVKTINIVYDIIDNYLKRPRIGVYFEFEDEKKKFYENESYGNFDTKKQKIITIKFEETIVEQGLINKKNIFDFWTKLYSEKYSIENLLVYFSAFEPIAKIEANERVPLAKVKQLKNELNCMHIWEIANSFSNTTFFLYTDEQVKQYENSVQRKSWADSYFDLLEPYNEFGYFKRDNFIIQLDSKENFDNNYESNWFYYNK